MIITFGYCKPLLDKDQPSHCNGFQVEVMMMGLSEILLFILQKELGSPSGSASERKKTKRENHFKGIVPHSNTRMDYNEIRP